MSKTRTLAETGKSVLRKIGEGVQTVKRVAGAVDKATGGGAGAAFQAAKSLPGVGAVASGAEQALGLADSYSKKGIKAIDTAERAGGAALRASGYG